MTNYFICLTPLHYYFSYAVAQDLYDKDKSKSVIAVKGNYSFRAPSNLPNIRIHYIPNKSFIEKVICALRYKYLFRLSRYYKAVCKGKSRVFVFNFNDYLTKNVLKCATDGVEVTHMEEGLGSWIHSTAVWNRIPDRVDKVLMGMPDIFMKNHPEFRGEIKKLSYQDFFTEARSKKFLELMPKFDIPGDISCIYLGFPREPFVEEELELKILRQVIGALPENQRLYIKKHPRDVSDKYLCLLQEFKNVAMFPREVQEIPIECIIWSSNIQIVLAIASSATLYLPLVKESVKGIYLYKIVSNSGTVENNSNLTSFVGNNLFEGIFQDIGTVYCPENLEELKSTVESIVCSL